jgi:hypothetical protein
MKYFNNIVNYVSKNKKQIATCVVVLIVLYSLYRLFTMNADIDRISNLTDKWIKQVTVENDPNGVYKLFCEDAILLGTVSTKRRKGDEILDYFYFFAKLPNIEVISSNYNIQNIGDGVYTNTAIITWKWDNQVPIVARMTFIYRGDCIVQLHSSAMPDPPEALKG